MYILSQIFVVISGLFFASSYLIKKKSLILIVNVCNNVFFALHFLLLNSLTAAYSVFLTIGFMIAIYLLEKYQKEKYKIIATIIFSLILIPITYLTWDGFLSLMPTIAILITFIGSIFNNTLTVKLCYFVSTVMNSIFMFIIHSYFGFGVNLAILITAIVGIVMQIKNLRNNKNNNIINS